MSEVEEAAAVKYVYQSVHNKEVANYLLKEQEQQAKNQFTNLVY